MGAYGQFARQFTVTKNFDPIPAAIGQPGATQRAFINARPVIETVERFEVHRQVTRAMARVVEPSFRDAANQRHLAAFKSNPNRAAGTRRLAFATPPAGFAVAA